jgi:hypothetical protein
MILFRTASSLGSVLWRLGALSEAPPAGGASWGCRKRMLPSEEAVQYK